MQDTKKLIEEVKRQIESMNQEIKDKELVLSNLVEQLENMNNKN